MNKDEGRDKVSVQIRQACADDFDAILKINAESVPHVAKLEAEDLHRLVALASFALVATDGVHLVGYALAFLSYEVYEGEEFRSFRARFVEPFLYIDQVAVCPTARRANIASQMYAWLQQRSHDLGIFTLGCGVNLRPANPVSMWFHRKLGFGSIGDLETRDGALVALLRKEAMPSAFRAITKTTEQDLPRLFEVWESSVRASHSFLNEVDIQSLIPLVKNELANFKPIYCLRAGDGNLFAFLGVAGFKIEMLFVHPGNRGNGAGRLLSEFAIEVLHASSVDVNEQNYQAMGFYRHLGFRRIGRSPLDPVGNPFPILHLALQPKLHHLRIARPVSDLARTRTMYCRGLGLRVVGSFEDHDGFDGLMLGMAGTSYHFEFTYCRANPVVPTPTREDLTVFYLLSSPQWYDVCNKVRAAGFKQVVSSNPYWDVRGHTYEDFDGYRIVLQNAEWNNVEEHDFSLPDALRNVT